jgi:hypothetical protein
LTVSALSNFSGDVTVEVAAGDESSEVRVAQELGASIAVPGVLSPRTILIKVEDGALVCRVTPNSSAQIKSCNTQELFNAN